MAEITQDLKDYIRLNFQKRELKVNLKSIQDAIDLLEEPLLEDLLQDGVTSIKIDGATVYMHRIQRARVIPAHGEGAATQEDRQRALEALEKIGMRREFETLNHNSLSAWARQLPEGLPDELTGSIRLDEETSLRVRKS